MSEFDLTTRFGVTALLQMQITGLQAVTSDGGTSANLRADMIARAADDLAALGCTAPQAPAMPGPVDPVAVDYVFLRSRMGSRVLALRWKASTDTAVQRAGRYFTAPDGLGDWRTFRRWAETQPATGAQADRAVADAARLFTHFEACATRAAQTQEPTHA
ncbi:MAG: hypothetical protein AAGF60_11380 [Pseudomonadota bacterium]